MGLFPNYAKPGPGVEKDAPKKKGFFLFWDIVFRKFSKLFAANAMYSLCSILWLVFLYIFAPVNALVESFTEVMVGIENAEETMQFLFRALFALTVFNLWGCAPVAAPYAYVTRCLTKGEHTWIMSDGWDKFKANLKQSAALFILDIVILIVTIADLMFYSSMQATGSSLDIVWQFLGALVIMVLIVYTLMHYYIYQIMVTYECSFVQLLKNAAICAVADLPMAILLTIISFGFNFILFMLINPAVIILFDLIAGLCITRYPMEFHAARILEKNMARLEKNAKSKTGHAKITYLEDENIENSDESEDESE